MHQLGPAELEAAWTDMETILQVAVADWQEKRQDYKDAFVELGSKGQFSEIWRKVIKLKNSVWDGYELRGESPAQIALEVIPHCLMLVYLLGKENQERRSKVEVSYMPRRNL
jgi:hypothetical protein